MPKVIKKADPKAKEKMELRPGRMYNTLYITKDGKATNKWGEYLESYGGVKNCPSCKERKIVTPNNNTGNQKSEKLKPSRTIYRADPTVSKGQYPVGEYRWNYDLNRYQTDMWDEEMQRDSREIATIREPAEVKNKTKTYKKGGIMNAKPKHPAVRKQSVASKVASAVKGAVKGAVAGKTKKHPAFRDNERGTANIAANRTARGSAPKQHPAMRPKKK